MTESREIILKTSSGDNDFRSFLSKKAKDMGRYISPELVVNPAVRLYSENGFSVVVKNTFDDPLAPFMKIISGARGIGKLMSVIGEVAKASTTALSGMEKTTPWIPWVKNTNAYKDTGPIEITMTFKFHMGEFGLWDAKEEVFKPIMSLMSMFIPLQRVGVNIKPHIVYSSQFLWRFIQNVDIGEFLKIVGSAFDGPVDTSGSGSPAEGSTAPEGRFSQALNNVGEAVDKASIAVGNVMVSTLNEFQDNLIDISYSGDRFKFRKMQPVNCDIKFTNKEYDDKGYPIQGEITLSFKSYQPPMVAGILQNPGNISFGFME